MSARGLSLRGPQIHLWLQLPCAFCLFLVSTPCFLANGLLLFISPWRHGHTVLDETQGSLLKEMSPTPPPTLGKHKRKTISEFQSMGLQTFCKNKLGKTLPPNSVNPHSWHVCSLDAMQVKRVFIVVETANLHVLCSSKYL